MSVAGCEMATMLAIVVAVFLKWRVAELFLDDLRRDSDPDVNCQFRYNKIYSTVLELIWSAWLLLHAVISRVEMNGYRGRDYSACGGSPHFYAFTMCFTWTRSTGLWGESCKQEKTKKKEKSSLQIGIWLTPHWL